MLGRFSKALLTALLALVLANPAVVGASVLPSDHVAGAAVSSVAEDSVVAHEAPDAEMAAGYLGTVEGRELWSRAPDKHRAMASTTKLMTAIVVLDSALDPDENVTVSKAAAGVGQAAVNLRAGDARSVRQLMEEMLVKSGNDAAAALAEHTAGSQTAFVRKMNEKARGLGLKDTHFANPHGLDAKGNYSTARDLAALARRAMRYPEIRRIVCMSSVTVTDGAGRKHEMDNTNVLIGHMDGMVGIKTGMTLDAGWCLIAQAERGPVKLLSVVLGTRTEDGRIEQSRRLLEWGFEHFRERRLASAGETMGLVPVADYLDVSVPAHIEKEAKAVLLDLDGGVSRTVELAPSVGAPVARGDRLGTLTIKQAGRTVAQVPITAVRAVRAPSLRERLHIWFVRTWRSWFGRQGEAEPAPVS